MSPRWRRGAALAALALGAALLAITLRRVDSHSIALVSGLFGIALVPALVPGAAWHVLRTEAWRRCFPRGQRLPFATIFRVRLAAEAFSYLTIAGVTGEPLKVVLLGPAVPAPIAAAATALERVVYVIVTAAILSVSAAVTAWTMPLTPRWATVFEGIAAVGVLLTIVPLWLVLRGGRPAARAAIDPPPARSRVRRFVRETVAHFRTLATGDRRQLAIVVVIEAAAFAMMALEVFAALSLTGTRTTLLASFAIETFTRVASFASAFIPGNIGALEVSNVAAAAALQVAQGGVALALLRRLRGLLWCAVGFLMYARTVQRDRRGSSATDQTARADGGTLVAIQHDDSDACVAATLGGMPVGERIARAAIRAGYTKLLVWTPRQRGGEWRAAVARLGSRLELIATGDDAEWRRQWLAVDPLSSVTVLAPGTVASPPLLSSARTLAVSPHSPLTELPAGTGYAGSGVFRTTARVASAPAALALRLSAHERRDTSGQDASNGDAHLTLRVETRADLVKAEQALRASIFKPTDGHLGRLNRRLSIPISIALIRGARLSANAMSVFVIALGLYAGWLFARGSYGFGVAAALLSWAASMLDGCDGELARLQFKESAFGCWVDTLGDYVYYLAIFAGLTVGAVRQTGWDGFWWCGAALTIGVLLTFALLILLRWQITDGRPEHLRNRAKAHFDGSGKPWARAVARLSTCATRATMPYGIVGFAIVGLLPVVVILATIGAQVYWISLAREFRRLVHDRAEAAPSPGKPPAFQNHLVSRFSRRTSSSLRSPSSTPSGS